LVVLRLRLCEPPPHERVQVDQALYVRTVQSVEHPNALHARVSAACGHTLPPLLGAALVRLRSWEPEPHDLVQVDHADHAPASQSAGHAFSLQVRVSFRYGHT
jgi:hypothetical protein